MMSLAINKKTLRRVIFGAAVTGLLWVIFAGDDGLANLYFRLYRRVEEMESTIRKKNAAIDSLTIEIQRLQSDTAYLEQMAREELGMAKKSETIYKFIEESE